MLILPLHQPLTRANFPWVTACLLLANLFVFVVLQGRDGQAYQQAAEYYEQSQLAAIEVPLYRRHLAEPLQREQAEQLAEWPEPMQQAALQAWAQADRGFRQRLDRGELFADPAAHADWLPKGRRFAELRGRAFTDRFALDGAEPGFISLFTSMYLHGGAGHLLGNMLFLVALGLLVEGPLGGALFFAVYTLGGLAAAVAWLLFHDEGLVLGASGAIAALMGAFCVLWGRRQVRFFYWFFVIFDYVKGPALALLPVWLGWELLQWLLSGGDRVAYEAHAGGIVAGAALAWLVRRLGWQREQAFEAVSTPRQQAGQLQQAMQLLGQLRIDEAERLLEPLAQQDPDNFDVALARYRCAGYGHDQHRLAERGQRLLALAAPDRAALQEQLKLILASPSWLSALPASQRLQLGQRLLAAGESEAGLALSLGVGCDQLGAAELAQALLRQALAVQPRDAGAGRRLLQHLLEQCPNELQAGKARFLLAEWGER